MRILCLHGYGTSAAIFESQLSAFTDAADANWEFVYLEGEHECQKAQGSQQRWLTSSLWCN